MLVSSDGIDYLSRYTCNGFSFLGSFSLHRNLLCVSHARRMLRLVRKERLRWRCLHEKRNYSFVTLDRDPSQLVSLLGDARSRPSRARTLKIFLETRLAASNDKKGWL